MTAPQASVTRWWWIRHAPVDSGGRIYGAGDPDCRCDDEAVFDALASVLPRPAVWVASHLRRTHQTAAAVARYLDAMPDLEIEPRFGEQSFGEWQGRTHDEVRRERLPEWHRFWLAPALEAPPGGESFTAMVERVRAGVVELTDRHRGQDIVAFAHGGTIRAALAVALEIDPERALPFAVDNCSLTCLEHFDSPRHSADEARDAWRVVKVNLLPMSPAGQLVRPPLVTL